MRGAYIEGTGASTGAGATDSVEDNVDGASASVEVDGLSNVKEVEVAELDEFGSSNVDTVLGDVDI